VFRISFYGRGDKRENVNTFQRRPAPMKLTRDFHWSC